MSIVPYLRPDLDQSEDRPPLYITGTLPDGKPGDAYERRLQIHNQIGACSIVSVTGDELPPGSSVYVDGDEIVVAWPAYVEAAAPITNPGFEDGMAGWQGGAGWSTTTNNPITGARSAVYYNAPGSSILSSQSRYPVNPGVPITATAAIRQGASSAGNAGAGVRLEWRDADGNLRRSKDGNMVMSASNNAVKPSSVTDSPQPGDELVNIACHGLRNRQNREVWADTFAWNHAVVSAGVNVDAQFCIAITVRDAAGRTAMWSGCVKVRAIDWATFDPLAKGSNIVLSNGNKRATYNTPNDNPGRQVFGTQPAPRPTVNGVYRYAFEAKKLSGGGRTGIGVANSDELSSVAPTQTGKGRWICVIGGIPTLYQGDAGMSDTGVAFNPSTDVLGIVMEMTHSNADDVAFVLKAYVNGVLSYTTLSSTVDPTQTVRISVGDGSFLYGANYFVVDIETDPSLMVYGAAMGNIGWGA